MWPISKTKGSSQAAGERQPLLRPVDEEDSVQQTITPLPKLQFSILLFLQMMEPTNSQVIYPFINQLIRELGITGGDPRKVGYYAGLIESLFFAAQAMTVLFWSRLSDRIGRKPVLLTGLLGVCISMTCFGLSRSFIGLVISRCLAGMTNGNIGVIKSMMGEITDSTNMAYAFSFISIVWALGGTIGPFAGGILSRPHDHFPRLFGNPFWAEFPYLLPCLFSASLTGFAFFLAAFFLKETVQKSAVSDASENGPPPLRDLMTRPIWLSIGSYCLMALSDTCLFALIPLFYSTPIELGGMGFSAATIGLCMGSYGIINGVIQVLLFAKVVGRLGPKRLIISSFSVLPFIFGMFPIINMFARAWGVTPLVWAMVYFQLLVIVFFCMSFGAVFIYVTSSAPSRRSLGSVNGMAQTTVSITRAFGPASATSLFAYSLQTNWLGGNAVYLLLSILPVLALFFAVRLPRQAWKHEK